jgi:hypothetical protein
MGTTTNNGWTYPESTDLVKDGATAIQTLADDIDTTLGVYAPSTSGLTLINTTSFSAVNQQNVTGVFSADYYHYKIVLNAIGSTTTQNVNIRVLSGTTPNTASNYRRQLVSFTDTTSQAARFTAETTWRLGRVFSSNKQMAWGDMFFPFETGRTQWWSFNTGDTNGNILNTNEACSLDVTTSYDGFQLNVGSGTMTGEVSVYGYNS